MPPACGPDFGARDEDPEIFYIAFLFECSDHTLGDIFLRLKVTVR